MRSSALAPLSGHAFVKGHGTENDFLLLPDHGGELDLGAAAVEALADRQRGLGADGVIRVVRSAVSGIEGAQEQAEAGAEWFMDYRNADGSIAEMCGNGVRVFAHHLVTEGLVPDEGEILVATRDGVKAVTRLSDPFTASGEPWYEVDIGHWELPEQDALVEITGVQVPRPGLRISTGNPHVVVALANPRELIDADLHRAPSVSPAPAGGINVELIVIEGRPSRQPAPGSAGELSMRVHERGVGETRSCGTGACAAAIAARHWAGNGAPDIWRVNVPGGSLRITISPQSVRLAGPAALVAAGGIQLA
ncbi:diaminopimelate epimerase [Sediminivirga luteola]|uniref:Diaminopimelate epimerase n=1 Tax=Sediminivirga luteola TaxID=1774748 RepID=A0A8J2TXH2_9MICO|nr:diaminopimelate epimerase [Sediminivirga luteola]MCI2266399.1 diaminopimelate epimerase [Sediminivirga luteola]GGA11795.1 diaminopimelate epimerase [Sediminivirga luteola]